MFGRRAKHRDEVRRAPFPEAWCAIIDRNLPYVRRLSAADRAELEGDIQVLLAEKRFEGCGGLTITDEIRVTIAAQAAVLLLHRDTEYFPKLHTILVYPATYVATARQRLPDGTMLEGPQARLGESWESGNVVLTWDNVLSGASDIHDGHNVVFHEFAHQLDNESGEGDGAPDLGPRSRYLAWARVLGEEYDALQELVREHHPSDIDAYGATNPAEFFAVATECFFEKSAVLKRRHPALYEQLAGFYRQDPAARRDPA